MRDDFENSYRYVNNDPVNNTDPSGLQKEFSMSQMNAMSSVGRSAGKWWKDRGYEQAKAIAYYGIWVTPKAVYETGHIGPKAIVNTAWHNTVGLVYDDTKDLWTVTEFDRENGYDISRVTAEVAFHTATAVTPHKLAVLANMAKTTKVKTAINITARTVHLYDSTLNARDIAKSSYDIYTNGFSLENTATLALSGLGSMADVKFLRDRLKQNRALRKEINELKKKRKLSFVEKQTAKELDELAKIDEQLIDSNIHRLNNPPKHGPELPPSMQKNTIAQSQNSVIGFVDNTPDSPTRLQRLSQEANKNLVVLDENVYHMERILTEQGYKVFKVKAGTPDTLIIKALESTGARFVTQNYSDFRRIPGVIRVSGSGSIVQHQITTLNSLEASRVNPEVFSRMNHIPASGMNLGLLKKRRK